MKCSYLKSIASRLFTNLWLFYYKQQDITVTGGTIIAFTTANGATTAFNGSFLGRDQQLLSDAVLNCINTARSGNLTIGQVNNCLNSIATIRANTVTGITVRWDATRAGTCSAKIGYSERVLRQICTTARVCDNPPTNTVNCRNQTTCGITFSDPNLKVNSDLLVCVGPQPAVVITGTAGCIGATSTYGIGIASGSRQTANARFRWFVNGTARPLSSSSSLTIPNAYVNGQMVLCVEVVGCNGLVSARFCKTLTPPIANTNLTGPSCVPAGGDMYVKTVGGKLKSVHSVKVNGVAVIYSFSTASSEIDFRAPNNAITTHSVNVTGIDECGAFRTLYFTFKTGNCTTNPICPYCSGNLTTSELDALKQIATTGMTEQEWIATNMQELLAKVNTLEMEAQPNAFGIAEFLVFPNPTSGNFAVELPTGAEALTVYYASGQMVQSYLVSNQGDIKYPIDLSTQPNGIYLIEVKFLNGEIKRQRLIVAR